MGKLSFNSAKNMFDVTAETKLNRSRIGKLNLYSAPNQAPKKHEFSLGEKNHIKQRKREYIKSRDRNIEKKEREQKQNTSRERAEKKRLKKGSAKPA